MERLTEEKQIGPWASLKDKAEAIPGAFANYDCLMAHMTAVTRLKAYEDTGLTPEEITKIGMETEAGCVKAIARTYGIDINRLRELAEADRAGRLAVLPCKDWLEVVFGDQVLFWGIDKDYVEQPIREISLDDADRIGWYDGYKTVFLKGTDENGEAWEFYPEEIGETVFLTREEAEAALEAMKDE